MEDLENDVLLRIVGHLPPKAAVALCCTCHALLRICRSEEAWQQICQRHHSALRAPAEHIGWRSACRQALTLSGAHWRMMKRTEGSCCKDELPVPRDGHSVTAVPGWGAVMFGGTPTCGTPTEESNLWLNDTWLLQLEGSPISPAGRWHRVRTSTTMPMRRATHDAAVINAASGECYLVIHGGLAQMGYRVNDTWRLMLPPRGTDLNTWRGVWEELAEDDDTPQPVPRFHHCFCSYDKWIVVVGGHNFAFREMNDTWVLDVTRPLSSSCWAKVPGRPFQRPCKRAYASLTAADGILVLYGGTDAEGQPLADPWILRMPVDIPVSQWEWSACCLPIDGLDDRQRRMLRRQKHSMAWLPEVSTVSSAEVVHLTLVLLGGEVPLAPTHPVVLTVKLPADREDLAEIVCQFPGSPNMPPLSTAECSSNVTQAPAGVLKAQPRNQAMCGVLHTGQTVVAGGSRGLQCDKFGDGWHEYELEETHILDVSAIVSSVKSRADEGPIRHHYQARSLRQLTRVPYLPDNIDGAYGASADAGLPLSPGCSGASLPDFGLFAIVSQIAAEPARDEHTEDSHCHESARLEVFLLSLFSA